MLPTSAASEGGNQGENDCALVVVASLAGQRVLVPGDAEGEVLAKLGIDGVAVVGTAASRQSRRFRRPACSRRCIRGWR